MYKVDKYIRNNLENIKKDHPESYQAIEDFLSDLIAEGISIYRVYTYSCWLKKIINRIDKKITEWDRRDIKAILNHYTLLVNSGKLSDNSLEEVKKTLKKFFKRLGKEELVNWFSLKNISSKVTPQDLITEEEFEAMLKACMNSRDRALISLLYESGAKIGEK